MTLSDKDLDKAAALLWRFLKSGKTEKVAQDKLCVTDEEYALIRSRMFDSKSEQLTSMSAEHVYIQYVIDQSSNIKKLDEFTALFKKNKQYNAMLGAMRLRSELLDKILAKGQECGVIHKEPERREINGSLMTMTLEQLQTKMLEQNRKIQNMVSGFGNTNFIDVDIGDIYHTPAPAMPASKSADKENRKRQKQKAT